MTTTNPIKIGLIEDQFLFRKGMRAILESTANLSVVFETGVGYDIVTRLQELPEPPDVLLVDVCLPPDTSQLPFGGLEVTKAVREQFKNIKVIILSVHHEPDFVSDHIRNGAHAYLIKDSDPQEVIDAIIAVHTRGAFINQHALNAIQRTNVTLEKKKTLTTLPHHDQVLSRREIEVLQLVCRQLKTEEIAEKLFISTKTVNGHRNNLLQKTGARNAAGLVTYAVKHRIVDVEQW